MATEPWQWLDTGKHDAAMNMAIDEVLLQGAEARGAPLFRVYGWTRPSISIGYFQPYPAAYESSHDIVRRPTGGGMVFHGKDLTFTFIAPPGHRFHRMRAGECYRELHSRLASALRRIGIACELQRGKASTRMGACFELPVAHDLMLGGKKITGGAQRRTKHGLLHQGSLLLPPSQRRPLAELKAALRQGSGVEWQERPLSPRELAIARELGLLKYATEVWNRKFTEAPQSSLRPPAR